MQQPFTTITLTPNLNHRALPAGPGSLETFNNHMGSVQTPPDPPVRTHIDDPHYGGPVVLSEHTRTVYQNALIDHRALPAFITLLRARAQLAHPHLLTLKNHFTKPQSLPAFSCENEPLTEVYIEYPYLTRTFEDVIEEYSRRGVEVPEGEVVRVFGAVGEALRFLAGEGTCHGDVKSANVLFDHTGTVKLIDSYFVNGGKTAYEIVLENPSSMSLLAPEQLQRIKNRQPEDLSTIHQSEIFALGLVMAEAMTYQPAMEFYDLEKMAIREDYKLKQLQDMRRSGYSPKLVVLVGRCISEDWRDRPSFEEFLKVLRS